MSFHYVIHDEKIDNKEIQISFAFSPDFPLPIPKPSLWKIRVPHQRWDWQAVSWLFLPPLLEAVSLPVPPSYKIIAGCRRSEKMLKELPGWREKRWEEASLSSSALDSGQTDPMNTLTFQTAAPIGKVSVTMHCAAQTWMSALLIISQQNSCEYSLPCFRQKWLN